MSLSSPFERVHERMGARFNEYDGWRLPADFGDPAAENVALQTGSAAFDLSSFGRIAVKGGDAERLVSALAGETALPHDEQWRLIPDLDGSGPLRIGCVKGGWLILTLPWRRADVIERINSLAASAEPSGVSIADMTEKTAMLGIYGPKSFAAIAKILPFDLSDLAPGGIRAMSFLMITITILRGGWTRADGVELICPAPAAPMAAAAVAKYQQRENIVPAGMDCLADALKKT